MLTQTELKRIFNYDPDTGLFTRRVATNSRTKVGDVADCHDNHGYIKISIDKKKYRVHRLTFLYMAGSFPTNNVDHINGARDDNRWANLRDVTPSVNSQNLRKPHVDNTSGYLGVSWHNQAKKWHVKIVVNSKSISLGLFNDVHQAAAHYLQKKRELHPGNTL